MIDFPPIEPGRPIQISATTYISYRRCPAQGLGRYAGFFPRESKPSFRGGLAHGLIARHLQSGPLDDPYQAAREFIGNSPLNFKMAGAGLNRPSLLGPVISEAVDLYRRFCRLPLEAFLQAEVELDHEPSPGVTLVGKVDALFVGPLLRDWKTGPLIEPLEQLRFYALIWALRERVVPLIEAVSLQTGESVAESPALSNLTEMAAHIADLVSLVRNDRVEQGQRRAGPWCGRCPLLENCPEGKAAVAVNT